MKLASIEIGTQTSRLLIAEWMRGEYNYNAIQRERIHTRLGAGALSGDAKRITEQAVERGVKALRHFYQLMALHNVTEHKAVATGILRVAENRDRVIEVFQSETGIKPEIISGTYEAQLTMLGVRHSLKIQNHDCLIFDIGGGSTEFILNINEQMEIKSIPLGCIELKEKYLTPDPPDGEAVERMMKHINHSLDGVFDLKGAFTPSFVIGTGGTVTNIGSILHQIAIEDLIPERIDGRRVKKKDIRGLFQTLIKSGEVERKSIPGIDPERADVLPAGVGIVISILDKIDKDELIICFSDILDGLLVEMINSKN